MYTEVFPYRGTIVGSTSFGRTLNVSAKPCVAFTQKKMIINPLINNNASTINELLFFFIITLAKKLVIKPNKYFNVKVPQKSTKGFLDNCGAINTCKKEEKIVISGFLITKVLVLLFLAYSSVLIIIPE